MFKKTYFFIVAYTLFLTGVIPQQAGHWIFLSVLTVIAFCAILNYSRIIRGPLLTIHKNGIDLRGSSKDRLVWPNIKQARMIERGDENFSYQALVLMLSSIKLLD